jgi:hypothetical protein
VPQGAYSTLWGVTNEVLNAGSATIASANTPQLIVPANVARIGVILAVAAAAGQSGGTNSGVASGVFVGSNQQITTGTAFQLLFGVPQRFKDRDDIWIVGAAGKVVWFAEEQQDQEPGTANTLNFARVLVHTLQPIQVVAANPHRVRLTLNTKFDGVWIGTQEAGLVPGNGSRLLPNVPNALRYNGALWCIAEDKAQPDNLAVALHEATTDYVAADLTYIDEVNF